MEKELPNLARTSGRAPHGARGLKYHGPAGLVGGEGRAPHGARGLKFLLLGMLLISIMSRPARGAWIEMRTRLFPPSSSASRPAWGAWIEIW